MAKDDKDTQTVTGDKKISEMTAEEMFALLAAGGQQSSANYLLGYLYPSRLVTDTTGANPADVETVSLRGGAGQRTVYRGPLLVDGNGKVVRNQYDLSPLTDANTILLQLAKDPARLNSVTNLLQTRGYYGNSKPSLNRLDSNDRSAMAEFLNSVANANGVTYDVALQMLEGMPQVKAAGTKAPSIRVTSPDDLKVVFRKASTDLLGYEIDDATAQKFAKTYQQMEIAEAQKQSAGGVFTSAASPSTVAEQQILQQFQPEAQSFATGNLASIMDARIKALGA